MPHRPATDDDEKRLKAMLVERGIENLVPIHHSKADASNSRPDSLRGFVFVDANYSKEKPELILVQLAMCTVKNSGRIQSKELRVDVNQLDSIAWDAGAVRSIVWTLATTPWEEIPIDRADVELEPVKLSA